MGTPKPGSPRPTWAPVLAFLSHYVLGDPGFGVCLIGPPRYLVSTY